MAVTNFLQMKLTPQPQSVDKTQQRIIMFMPLIFLFICYNFASALALYWTTQNIYSILQAQIQLRFGKDVTLGPPSGGSGSAAAPPSPFGAAHEKEKGQAGSAASRRRRHPLHPRQGLMTPLDQARQILDTLLGYLGFVVTIEEDNGEEGPTLQILCEEPDDLIGRRGEVLEDIQYLVNRILLRRDPARAAHPGRLRILPQHAGGPAAGEGEAAGRSRPRHRAARHLEPAQQLLPPPGAQHLCG